MKIGIVTTWFERGAAYVSKQFLDALTNSGHEVFIYARGGESYAIDDPNWNKKNVYWSKKYIFPVLTYIENDEFENWLLKNHISAVLFNEQRWFLPLEICRKLKIKSLLYVDYYTESSIRALTNFDVLICNTKRHYSVFKDIHSQAYYIPWGTDIDLYDIKQIREVSSNLRFFHSAGMGPKRKGTDLLLIAFLKLIHKYPQVKDVHLIIHSQVCLFNYFENISPNPDAIEALNSLINLNLITVINKTVSAPGLYHLGDIYVYPSKLEGIGLTIAEAMAASMPVIVPNDGPMNEFIPVEFHSLLVDVKNYTSTSDGYYWPQNNISVDSLVDKLFFFTNNRNLIPDISRKFRTHAEKNLNWGINSKEINSVFLNTKLIKVNNKNAIYANKFYSESYPLIDVFPTFYKYIYKFLLYLNALLFNRS